MKVKATREGLISEITASGYRIELHVPFVALPSRAALGRAVKVTNPLTGKSATALVLDVGPFNVNDDEYVFHGARPLAESGESISHDGTNGAGIDLGEFVWHALGMTGNTDVEWAFLD